MWFPLIALLLFFFFFLLCPVILSSDPLPLSYQPPLFQQEGQKGMLLPAAPDPRHK